MRTNAMKKCAVGAMLFGGTLGATSAANAGLVVWNCNISLASYINGSFNYGTFVNVETQQFYSDTATLGSVGTPLTAWDLRFSSNEGSRLAMFSNDPPIGFVSATGSGSAKLASGSVVGSSLESPFSYTQTGSLLIQVGNPNRWYAGDTGYFGFKFMMASGALRYAWAEIALNSGSLTQGTLTKIVYEDTGASVTVGVIPAPGAIALLGLAGLAGRRRR